MFSPLHCRLSLLAFIQIELQTFAKIWATPIYGNGVRSVATYFHLRNGIGQLGKFWLLQHSEPEIFIRKYLFYASQENDKNVKFKKAHLF